jgi:ribosomal protein S19E (S16A)
MEKTLSDKSLSMLKRFGVTSIQMGSRTLSKKGKDVIEETPTKIKKEIIRNEKK